MKANCEETNRAASRTCPLVTFASTKPVKNISCFGVMGASTDAEISALIAQQVEFYKAASAKKSTSNYAHSEVQETYISGNSHLTGSNKPPSTQSENPKYVQCQTQRRVFLDKNPVSKKWVSQDDEESHHRPHHGQDFVEAGKSVAEFKCNEISKCQSNQLDQADSDQSLRDHQANIPTIQPEATVTQSTNDDEVAACWPKLKQKDVEEDHPSPGMDESRCYSDVSCETEDSCDYSSGTEDNKTAFTLSSKSILQEAANSFENENEDKVAQAQMDRHSSFKQRLRELMNAAKPQTIITIDSDSEDEYVASLKMVTSGLDSAGIPKGVKNRRQKHPSAEVIVIDSDTEDDGDQSTETSTAKRASPSVGEDAVSLVLPSQQGQRELETAKNTIPTADLLLSGSQRQEDTPKDTEEGEGPFYDSVHGAQPTEPKDVCDKVENKIGCSEAFERTKDFTSRSNSSDDCRQSAPSSLKNGENKEIDLQSKKLKISFGNSATTLPLEIPPPADLSTTGSKKTDASEKSQLWLSQKKKGEHLSKLKLGNPPKPSLDKNVEQRGLQSKHLSPTTNRDLPSSTCRSILSSRKNCEAGQSSPSAEGSSRSEGPTSTNGSRKKLKRVTFAPRPNSPFKRLARSTSAPSTSETPATSALGHQVISPKGFSPCAATKSSSRMKVLKDWADAHYPTRIERKYHQGVEQNVEAANGETESINHTSNTDSDAPVRPELGQPSGAPRQRRRSQDYNTSLMKKSRNEAVEWTKATHRQSALTKSESFKSSM